MDFVQFDGRMMLFSVKMGKRSVCIEESLVKKTKNG